MADDLMSTSSMPEQRIPYPNFFGLWLRSMTFELKVFLREKDAMVFLISLPPILLILLGSIFKGQPAAPGVSLGQLFAAGVTGGGIATTSFQNLGISIAIERDRGHLKRLAATPMPKAVYFFGKAGLVTVAVLVETVLLVVVGVLIDHTRIPSSAEQWWTLAWVVTLGSVTCALLGIAISSVPRTARSASAIIAMPFIVLQFISGVYVPMTLVPTWLRDIASVFPLKWICQGLQSVFLPASAVSLEPAHSWEHGRTALILVAWAIAGFLLCITMFRWQRRTDS